MNKTSCHVRKKKRKKIFVEQQLMGPNFTYALMFALKALLKCIQDQNNTKPESRLFREEKLCQIQFNVFSVSVKRLLELFGYFY